MAKLTIGMIIKNEEKNLRRTLEALEPLRSAINCQLVIADTGSTDQSMDIAREFTNEVFSIPWENDFAKARNATVLRSRGKWYFYLDADEVLSDPQELIDFLLSKEEKQFKTIEIEIHNIMSQQKGVYTDSWSARFFRPELGVRFTEAIHERHDVYGPVYRLQKSRLVHYGYDNDTPGWMMEKARRNIKIMEDYVAQDMPLNRKIKALLDYADSLLILPEKRDTFNEIVMQAIALIKPLAVDNAERICQMARAYSLLLRVRQADQQSEETLALGETYLDDQPIRGVWDMDIYYALGSAAQAEKKYEQSIEWLNAYLNLRDKDICDVTKFFVLMSLSHQDYAYYRLSQVYIELGQYEEAWQAARSIEREQLETLKIKYYWWQLAYQYNPAEHLPMLFAELEGQDADKESLLSSLAAAVEDKKTTPDIRRGICQALYALEPDDKVLQVLALYVDDGDSLLHVFERLNACTFPVAYGGILSQCMRLKVPMQYCLPYLELIDLESYLAQCNRSSADLAQAAYEYYRDSDSLTMPLLELRVAQYILCFSLFYTTVPEQICEPLLALTVQFAYAYMNCIYQPVLLDSDLREAALSPLELFICAVKPGLAAKEQGSQASYVRSLRQGIQFYPRAKDVAATIIDSMTKKTYSEEFMQLAQTIKEQIKVLLDKGQAEDARPLLDELAEMLPEDEEIAQFKERLWMMRY